MSALRDSAEALVALGTHIFPLPPRSKIPFPGSSGKDDARCDASPCRSGTLYNIAWMPASVGLIGMDLDKPEHWADAQEFGLSAEPTFEVVTGPNRDGCRRVHRYFRGTAPSHGAQLKSIVVRAAKGYMLFPPSIHPDGHTYSAIGTFADAIALPPRATEELARGDSDAARSARVSDAFAAQQITSGNRHPAFSSIIGHLAAKGVDESYTLVLIQSHNLQACDVPKSPAEITRLVRDIYRAEARNHPERVARMIEPAPSLSETIRPRPMFNTAGGRILNRGGR